MSAINPKPINTIVNNPKPSNSGVINIQPKNIAFGDKNFAYLETKTILKGQSIPWGLNWLITYPIQLTFQAVRN